MSSKNVIVAGATGAVGQEILRVLEKRNFPIKNIKLLASKRSVGKKLEFKGEQIAVEELTEKSFSNYDIALFSAGGDRSKQFAKYAVDSGCVVVDNSSAFRMDENTPLVIPEINPEDIKQHKGIIANPNCSTIIMLVPLYPIHKLSKITRIIVATYQATSGAGAKAMEELVLQTKAFLENKEIIKEAFPYQIAFNLFSHNTKIYENGYCQEEMKMVNETKKIFHSQEIKINPTTIRIPILRAHSEAITVETEKKLELDVVREALSKGKGIKIIDDRENNYFPMPVEASGKDEILVGRLRYDISSENGINLFVAGDQLLKGAALNAVQIAEYL